jgi:hydroxyacylglutathione hydrolase
MSIQVFVFNPIQENTFVIYDQVSGECAIIDPGCINDQEFEQLKGFITANNLKPVKLINTHCHFDHILGVERCRTEWNLKWEAHLGDTFMVDRAQAQAAMFGISISPIQPVEISLVDNSKIKFGNIELLAIHVPGHSPGSICLYNKARQTLIAGDVLFRGSIGRTDLPQGDYNTLIDGIKSKLLTLPSEVKVYPGHGPSTTIGYERNNNPFLQ